MVQGLRGGRHEAADRRHCEYCGGNSYQNSRSCFGGIGCTLHLRQAKVNWDVLSRRSNSVQAELQCGPVARWREFHGPASQTLGLFIQERKNRQTCSCDGSRTSTYRYSMPQLRTSLYHLAGRGSVDHHCHPARAHGDRATTAKPAVTHLPFCETPEHILHHR